MINEFIKHQVYDMCINMFFSKLSKNFNRINIDLSLPKIGSFYRLISHNYGDESYHNCLITDIETRGSDDAQYYIIYVKYEYSTGEDIIKLNDVETYFNELEDEEYNDIFGDETTTIADLFENNDLEFLESNGVIALNSKYYEFFL